jgi:hypothetical protein
MKVHSKSTHGKSGWCASLGLLATTAALVAGCGGGGSGYSVPPTPQNAAPIVSAVPAQTVNQDTPTAPLAFTVSDDGGAGSVIVTASSSDPNLLPARGLVLSGTTGNRSITVTPGEDATGSANVTLTATDMGGQSVSTSFPVTVKTVSQSIASYTTSAFALMETDTPVQVSGFTFVQDADDDATFAPLLQ